MGKKVNPIILRASNLKNSAISWSAKWFAKKNNFAFFLKEDQKIRQLIKNKIHDVGLDKITIERSGKENMEIILYVSKPGVIIGRGGEKSERLKKEIQNKIDQKYKLRLTIKEISKPDLNSEVLLEEAIHLIEKRAPFRRVMKKILEKAKRAGAQGAKITMAGRLNGVEIAREEKLSFGQMPLQNLRANIDYARGAATTKWGQIGIKIWIYKGEVFEKRDDNNKDKK